MMKIINSYRPKNNIRKWDTPPACALVQLWISPIYPSDYDLFKKWEKESLSNEDERWNLWICGKNTNKQFYFFVQYCHCLLENIDKTCQVLLQKRWKG